MAEAHFSDYPAREITHPLSGKRLIALADHFDNRKHAEQLRELGKLVDDPEIRAGFVATGLAGRLEDLAPRREVLPPRRIRLRPGDRTSLFHGAYHGEIVRSTEPEPLAVQLGLERQGDRVYGHYTFGLGSGFLYGEVKGKDLHFDWKWAGNSGHGVLNSRDDGSFTGTWGYRNASSGAVTWTGRRDPCGEGEMRDPFTKRKSLGLHPNTLRSRMKRLGIARAAGRAAVITIRQGA
jgi:hypothetical protein